MASIQRTFSKNRDAIRVATKVANILLHPLQQESLIEQTKVAIVLIRNQPTERAQAIVAENHHRV